MTDGVLYDYLEEIPSRGASDAVLRSHAEAAFRRAGASTRDMETLTLRRFFHSPTFREMVHATILISNAQSVTAPEEKTTIEKP